MLTTTYTRIGATTAIAAALALTPAIAAAQQADSTASTTTSTTTDTGPPAEASPNDAAPAPAAEAPPAPDAGINAAAPVVTRHFTRTVTTRTVHVAPRRAEAPPPVAVAPVRTAPAAAPLASAPPPDASLLPPQPVAAAPAPVAAQPQSHFGETLLELGAGLIGLIALAWIALALARRRRVRDEIDQYDYSEPAAEPVPEPAAEPVAIAEPVAPVEPEPAPSGGIVTSGLRVSPAASYFSDRPAFDWSDRSEGADRVSAEDDRLPGESWTERAHRGPSADNPSLSLKKRLKRAAFFERREREAAAGRAVPVDPDAGLPESITEDGDLQAA